MLNDLMLEPVVRFVDIDGIIDHHCFKLYFHKRGLFDRTSLGNFLLMSPRPSKKKKKADNRTMTLIDYFCFKVFAFGALGNYINTTGGQ